jgi:membrane associated rhomboid family serine protease
MLGNRVPPSVHPHRERILGEVELVSVRVANQRKRADEWALVLASQGLHPHVAREVGGFGVFVAEPEREHAVATLASYDRENRVTPAPEPQPFPAPDLFTATLLFAALLAFFTVTGPRDHGIAWFALGSADSDRILAGETWRAVTALTLHADLGHAIGNAAAGIFFVGAVCGALGYGLGGAPVLATGAIGNLVNAHFHASAYSSVGASTAVFGALGIIASLGVVRHWQRGVRGRRALVPVAAGLGLLAMLGTGARSDLSGHIFGLAAGILIGLPAARLGPKASTGLLQLLLAVAAIAFVLSCWATALQGTGPGMAVAR